MTDDTSFLADADALVAIERARAKGRPILGIDSFIIDDSGVHPLLDHILDLSSAPDNKDTWSEARAFVEERSRRNYFFEIVI